MSDVCWWHGVLCFSKDSLSGFRHLKQTDGYCLRMATKESFNTLPQKTLSMCFSIRHKVPEKCHITTDTNEIEVVNEFKYLGVTLDPQLRFDAHIKKLSKPVKTSLNCFRLIRSCLSFKAAHLYLHAMVLSHLSYCIAAWGQATDSATRPLLSLYKQALNIWDQKPQKWHHCKIIEKYSFWLFPIL